MDPNQEPTNIPLETPAPTGVPSHTQKAVGAVFLGVSLIGALGLLTAVIPTAILDDTAAQAAAAAATAAEIRATHYEPLTLEASSVYVFDIQKEMALYEKNANAQLPLASITKVMTALVASEVIGSSEMITISEKAHRIGGGIPFAREEWRARDLIDLLLVASSNTAGEALREIAEPKMAKLYPEAPADAAFIWRMNGLAQELGLNSTYFINPTGLDESTTQAGAFGSARDIAELFAYAHRYDPGTFQSTVKSHLPLGPHDTGQYDAENTNDALSSIPNLIMGKTGLTDLAGGNLAIMFEPEKDRPMVIVVLNSSETGRFEDVKKLVSATIRAVQAEEGTPKK